MHNDIMRTFQHLHKWIGLPTTLEENLCAPGVPTLRLDGVVYYLGLRSPAFDLSVTDVLAVSQLVPGRLEDPLRAAVVREERKINRYQAALQAAGKGAIYPLITDASGAWGPGATNWLKQVHDYITTAEKDVPFPRSFVAPHYCDYIRQAMTATHLNGKAKTSQQL